MCVEMCYDVLPCVNGFLFRSFVVNNVPVSAFVSVLVLETNVMILTSNKRGKELCSGWCLCMKNEKNIDSKVAVAWIYETVHG